MSSFDHLWMLVKNHGSVAEFYKADLERLWNQYTLDEQRQIYSSIRNKLQAGKFVHYNPVKAVLDNVPKTPPSQTLTYAEYYKRYGTTDETDGWQKKYLHDEQRTIYVKS